MYYYYTSCVQIGSLLGQYFVSFNQNRYLHTVAKITLDGMVLNTENMVLIFLISKVNIDKKRE